jgi:ankyrin repeat protein
VDVTLDGHETALHVASRAGHLEAVQWLVSLRADVNCTSFVRDVDGCGPLYAAAQSGSIECVRALIDARANLERNDSERSVLRFAACAPTPDVLQYFLFRSDGKHARS